MIKPLTRSLLCGALLSAGFSLSAHADIKRTFELPDAQYLQQLPTPETLLGYPLGKWHLRHDQLNQYIKTLAENSERVTLEETGFSHEQRQQLSLVISSKANQQNLDKIINQRGQVKNGKGSKGPVVIWLAYSIHGDEASGSHAAMALSYYLSASKEQWVQDLLDDAIVIITPSQNPDGMDRFATWANNNRSNTLNTDPNNREHHQHWARGRLNHYLADLNRDWLFLRHPESQGRVALFHKWQPHYVGDFHEMGHRSSYFFQPGVPSRTHPLTPQKNQLLTDKIANYHRAALDSLGQAYYSKQSFDDFFYGKGSTYPDINGAIGVLYEQASARGKAQTSMNGVVTLERAIQNQFATSLSSLKGAFAVRNELHQYQNDFFADKAFKSGSQDGWLMTTRNDNQRRDAFVEMLKQHKIKFSYLTSNVRENKQDFTPNDSLFIPSQQPQVDLVAALFDKRTKFKDATFYDVSSFDMAAAFNLTVVNDASLSAKKLTASQPTQNDVKIDDDSVAVLIDWQQGSAAPWLQQVLSQGVIVKFTQKPFVANTNQAFAAGSLQVNLTQDNLSRKHIIQILQDAAQTHSTLLAQVNTFAAISGGDLGSPDVQQVLPVTPLLLTDGTTNPMEVGQVWNYLDNTLQMPVTLSDTRRLSRINTNQYSHIIMAHGSYGELGEKQAEQLKAFVRQGGTIIAMKSANSWLKKHGLIKTDLFDRKQADALFETDGLSFADRANLRAKKTIGGAIVNLDLDLTHPLSFGLNKPQLKVMKKGTLAFNQPNKPFIVAADYGKDTLSSGFMASNYQSVYPNKSAFIVERIGRGRVIGFADNLLFRNIWLGSEKVVANALFFAPSSL
ncbi:peptidase M14 [Shewanella sp. OPT22]|nr:peptidase M14 [Shewanella sp. OPT22]